MNLESLLKAAKIDSSIDGDTTNIRINRIHFDSRKVKPGDLFVAFSGDSFDGHDFLNDALLNGASAIMGEQSVVIKEIPYIQVQNARKSMAELSAAMFGFPAKQLKVIGVTGTDGKTTTVKLIYELLLAHGIKAGMISTVNAQIGGDEIDTGFHVTTPESPTIQEFLHRMVENGLTHAVIETTSHGLDQNRVDSCEFDVGVITNITHEHLDYHKDYEGYFRAKFKLIEKLVETKPKEWGKYRKAVINRDDISYKKINETIREKGLESVELISYGIADRSGQLRAEDVKSTRVGTSFNLCIEEKKYEIGTPLVGLYNVSNILAAIGALVAFSAFDPVLVRKTLREFLGVPGRMERIEMGQDFQAIVDFAHTPNALKVSLETARELTDGCVIAVFGSAGLRDREKRRLMAEVSAKLADISIITAEDPRTETLDDILIEMVEAAQKNGAILGENLFSIEDRGAAIQKAVDIAKESDLVISCGKGHEQSMCFGTIEYPWDDRIAMRAALSHRLQEQGPEMPKLPTSKK